MWFNLAASRPQSGADRDRSVKNRDLKEWEKDLLAPMIRRRDGGGRGWCPQWWRHPEVVAWAPAVLLVVLVGIERRERAVVPHPERHGAVGTP